MKKILWFLSLVVCLMLPMGVMAKESNSAFSQVKVEEPVLVFTVTGEAHIRKAAYSYRVSSESQFLKNGHGKISNGTFKQTIALKKSLIKDKKNLTLDLYEERPKDGKPINILSLPLKDSNGITYSNKAFCKVKVDAPYVLYRVTGKAKVFEGTYHYKIKYGNNILAKGWGTAPADASGWGDFDFNVTIAKAKLPPNGAVKLQLYAEDSSDNEGSPRLQSLWVKLDSFPWK